jgi:hypothetical protein
MTRFITILFSCLCVSGFAVSVWMWSAEDSQTYTADGAFVQFLQHGFEFQISTCFCLLPDLCFVQFSGFADYF